jgi:hypothetical protein
VFWARECSTRLSALDEQSVTVPGTAAAEKILPRLADSLRDAEGEWRSEIARGSVRVVVGRVASVIGATRVG